MARTKGGRKRLFKTRKQWQNYYRSQMVSGLMNDSSGKWGKPTNSRLDSLLTTVQGEYSVNQYRNERNRLNRKHSLQTRSWEDTIALNHRLHAELYTIRP